MPYIHHPHHRHAQYANQKSQWIISEPQELSVYLGSVKKNWRTSGAYWGLALHDNSPQPLGVSPRPSSFILMIAKFVADEQNNWHGYPVAHWLSPWDKPDISILKEWKDSRIINKAKMAKIHRGYKCSL